MEMNQIATAFGAMLTDIVLAIIAFLGALAISYIGVLKQKGLAAIQSVKSDETRKFVVDTIVRASDLVTTVVTSIEQEEKPEIVKALADGKVTRDELCKLKEVAVTRVMNGLSDQAIKVVEDTYGDAVEWVTNKVSQEVFNLKLLKNINKEEQ